MFSVNSQFIIHNSQLTGIKTWDNLVQPIMNFELFIVN